VCVSMRSISNDESGDRFSQNFVQTLYERTTFQHCIS